MIVTTSNDIAGQSIKSYLGIVRGIVVRSPTIGQGVMGGLKQIVGGNGWACEVLGINNNDKKKPSFADIEKHVNLNHLKPFYKLASNYIHAGFKGVIHRIGTPKSIRGKVYVGPTIFGLTDAGQHMAISINLITSTLLSLKPTFTRNTILIANSKLIKEMQEEFLKVEQQLKEENTV
jgi:hypothetical protein